VNKIDRPSARPDWVVEQVFDLFDSLGATDEQLDFPIVYASALNGVAGLEHEDLADNMDAVFLHEDVWSHSWVPLTRQVTEVHTSI
jgi:GTP-binding protein